MRSQKTINGNKRRKHFYPNVYARKTFTKKRLQPINEGHNRLWKQKPKCLTTDMSARMHTDALGGQSMHAAEGRCRKPAEIQLLWYKTKKHHTNTRVPNDVSRRRLKRGEG